MKLKRIETEFSVCKVPEGTAINLDAPYCFVGKTDEEVSLVCPIGDVPADTLERDDGWRAFRIQGTLDFSLIGILAGIAACLAEQGIGIFAISTFNTDYILTKKSNFERALSALAEAGYEIE